MSKTRGLLLGSGLLQSSRAEASLQVGIRNRTVEETKGPVLLHLGLRRTRRCPRSSLGTIRLPAASHCREVTPPKVKRKERIAAAAAEGAVRVVSFNCRLSDGRVSPDLTIGIRPGEKP